MIKSLSRLLSSQVTKHDHAKSFCQEKLEIHEESCRNNEAIKIEMPEKGSFIYFIHHNRKFLLLFTLISKHLRKRFLHANQTIKKVLQNNIKNINRVDFVIKLSVLMKNYSIQNQFSSEQKTEKNWSKCLRRISRGLKTF